MNLNFLRTLGQTLRAAEQDLASRDFAAAGGHVAEIFDALGAPEDAAKLRDAVAGFEAHDLQKTVEAALSLASDVTVTAITLLKAAPLVVGSAEGGSGVCTQCKTAADCCDDACKPQAVQGVVGDSQALPPMVKVLLKSLAEKLLAALFEAI